MPWGAVCVCRGGVCVRWEEGLRAGQRGGVCGGLQGARVAGQGDELAVGKRCTSNGMLDVHAVGRGVGGMEHGGLCSGAQPLLVMGCRTHVVSLCN